MKHLIVFSHPNPASFNFALKETIAQTLANCDHQVRVSDLYAKEFSAILDARDFESFQAGVTPADIAAEQALIDWADNLIFVYPIWWFNRPARLQGWIDRVFSHGYAYRENGAGLEPLLLGKTAQMFITFGGDRGSIEQAFGSIDALVAPMTLGTLNLVGIDPVSVTPFFEVPTVTQDERGHMLDGVRRSLLERYAGAAVGPGEVVQ
ncbi:NAD(P)H-dependent oxidoreductase [Parahaliea mediterranea]|uniref:NAD(P)H-dependent oxidoreductase n=1 Tax=Parahaliea mediterranea TaxID=651086 RepID=A0A939DG73_9GAMM|nr:NAD(P)H-dependent oxidoreductase [Parahaliea mediterranea]MBN7797586.1 NAD(P)H-dependent oxidoreductase [Parahaliea mediterranea]